MWRRRQSPSCCVFKTSWGWMGVVAGRAGIVRILLPLTRRSDAVAHLRNELPAARDEPGDIADFIEQCRAYFRGEAADFRDIKCILPPPRTFDGKVLRACRRIPLGETVGYGCLAKRIDRPAAARAVAAALGRNPVPLVVPCHRVIMANGRVGGFSAPGGVTLKNRLLDHERQFMNSGCRPLFRDPSSTG